MEICSVTGSPSEVRVASGRSRAPGSAVKSMVTAWVGKVMKLCPSPRKYRPPV